MIGCIMVVDVLTCCALLHSMWDLKATQMNVQHSLMIYEFKLDHNAAEAAKNIRWVKGEGAVNDSTVIICFKKFYLCHILPANSTILHLLLDLFSTTLDIS